ncbi:T9SS type A sorting domain-containing protein [Patiriisocius marinus]|uniref:T9SS type A sorting domain-containing protein n=1 Tax=Patiriisocius marinus TaxID=1397112 RepID=UPI00232AEA65|nr:T9SS type A sorting domain-containing protein [Patiriisocius marinus]
MKNLILLAWVFISTQVLAQDPQLFEDTWYIQKLTISDMSYFPPNISNPVTEHVFNKADLTFATGYCDPLGCELTYDDTNSSFNIDSVVELGLGCINQEDYDFHDIYFDYLEEHLDGANPYSYEITTNNGIRFLELTNANGNKALYANQLLNTNEQQLENVALYPNPVKNELSIKTVAVIERLEIYSITGQLVKQQTLFTDKVSFNTEDLIVGVYFVKITTNEGLVSTHKIIKE